MMKAIRFFGVVTVTVLLTAAAAFAQSAGQATYKAKCQSCHGVDGMAATSIGKLLKTLPVTDPVVKKNTVAQMFEFTKNGKDKMQPFKGKLTDAEIKGAVDYFRTFIK
jgi:mono/diheme cytochrome c family protein